MPHSPRPDRYRSETASRRYGQRDPHYAYDDRHHGGYGYDDGHRYGRDGGGSWLALGRRAAKSLGRFAIVAAIIVIPLIIAVVVGVILLLVWLLGNTGPLTGTLDGVSQLIQQISKIVSTFGGGGGG